MSHASESERRHFTRVDFEAQATISQGDYQFTTRVIDLSLNGVLVETPADYRISTDQSTHVRIELSDDAQINMTVTMMHSSNSMLGFQCESLDMESAGHLRRLIELNMGNSDAAERVLTELLSRYHH